MKRFQVGIVRTQQRVGYHYTKIIVFKIIHECNVQHWFYKRHRKVKPNPSSMSGGIDESPNDDNPPSLCTPHPLSTPILSNTASIQHNVLITIYQSNTKIEWIGYVTILNLNSRILPTKCTNRRFNQAHFKFRFSVDWNPIQNTKILKRNADKVTSNAARSHAICCGQRKSCGDNCTWRHWKWDATRRWLITIHVCKARDEEICIYPRVYNGLTSIAKRRSSGNIITNEVV